MKVVIPAAGAGIRFKKEGFTLPKELLPLGGKPLIAHALAEAKRAGFDSAIVVVSPFKKTVQQYLSRSAPPLPIEFVTQPTPLGIGDAVLRSWQGEAMGVLLPDDVVLETLHWTDLIDLYQRTGAATLCVRPVPMETTSRFGIVECDGDQAVRVIEKPGPGATSSNLAIFGRYVATESVISGLNLSRGDRELELTEGFAWALKAGPGVRAIPFMKEIFDCGTPSEYARSMGRFPDATPKSDVPRSKT